MTAVGKSHRPRLELEQRLAEAEATIEALLSGQIDAVVDARSHLPVLLSRAHQALRRSEERYRCIVETANEGIWTLDTVGQLTFVNQRLADMLGWADVDMVGQPLSSVLGAAAEAAMASLRGSQEAQVERLELEVARRDGSKLWALIRVSPIRDTEGTALGVLGMMTDNTGHRRAEDALRRSEQQYRRIVEATSDGILTLDARGRVGFANGRVGQMLGRAPEDLVGLSVFDLLAAPANDLIVQQFGQDADCSVETALRDQDGAEVEVHIVLTRVLDEDGHCLGRLAVVRDDPEKRKRQSQRMVNERMTSVGTLAAGVAHEINNPLAAVLSNLSFLSNSLVPVMGIAPPSIGPGRADGGAVGEIKAAIDEARDAAERVRYIVRDLKLLSRSPHLDSRGPIDVEAVLDATLRLVWNEMRKRTRLVRSYGQVPKVEATEARLGQVFINLLINAAHALPADRAERNEVRVATRVHGGRVVIEVSDNGPGIPPEIITRIFDAFFTTKPVGVGTGLGLAICQRLVDDMSGEITVQSEPGQGATFRVELPIARG